MKKGKWNYTEDIEYTVILVKLIAMPEMPMSWQNVYAGQERQVVLVKDGTHQFWIDNQDGSGLYKISKGGGPDSYSAHVGAFEYIRELFESEWQEYSKELHENFIREVDEWQEKYHPEQYKKMVALRNMIKKHR